MTAIAKPFQEQTYYELLEVSPHASMDEIRAAYHRAIELYAPESVAIYALENPTLAEELRAKLQEAMEILTDTDLRPEYDRSIGLSARPVSEAPPEEDEDEDAGKAAIAEVMPPPEAVDSTHRELKVSYVADKPAPAAPEEPRPSKEAAPALASESASGQAEAAPAKEPPRAEAPKPEAPKPEAQKPKGVEIAQDADFGGELIRQAREAKGLSLQQLSERTRISSRHLENIEADRYKELPATVYLRGMLMSLAREIGLDPLRVAKSYLALAARGGRTP